MKIKAILAGILVGAISAILSYYALISPATVAAIAMRRKMPDAWFSGLIVWYATFIVILVSIVVAGVASRVVYRHVADSAPRSTWSDRPVPVTRIGPIPTFSEARLSGCGISGPEKLCRLDMRVAIAGRQIDRISCPLVEAYPKYFG